jgi:hypothetical protein
VLLDISDKPGVGACVPAKARFSSLLAAIVELLLPGVTQHCLKLCGKWSL